MEQRIGCGDNSCIFSDAKPSGGMGTNGGCRCFENLESWIESEKRWNREEIRHVRQSVMIQQRMYRDKIKALESGSEIKRLIKMRESVYVLVRRNNDMKGHMVEIKGIFKSKEEAINHRQYIYDKRNIETEVETYQLLDTVTIGET